jgi:hypothetical protein
MINDDELTSVAEKMESLIQNKQHNNNVVIKTEQVEIENFKQEFQVSDDDCILIDDSPKNYTKVNFYLHFILLNN